MRHDQRRLFFTDAEHIAYLERIAASTYNYLVDETEDPDGSMWIARRTELLGRLGMAGFGERPPMGDRDDLDVIALAILKEVRLNSREAESEWAESVIGKCHVWGDFYGPATSKHLARALAHRYLDRQGCSPALLALALEQWRGK